MFVWLPYLYGLLGVLMLVALGWLVSLVKRDVSIVDSLWSLAFLLAAGTYALTLPQPGPRWVLVLVLVAVWALRLAVYVTWRNWGAPEDRRYRAIRRNHEPGFALKSSYLIFGLQGVLAWIISLPLLAAMAGQAPLGWVDAVAVVVWLGGMVFEAGGDWQLARFKADPVNRERVMARGLWRYTRHPNYFGDCCVWWSYYLLALVTGGWWSIIGPLLMTVLLLKVSGVALLEQDISERRPAYRDYVRRTNAFIPGPSRGH